MKNEPIDALIKPLSQFIRSESNAGIVLFISAVIALVWANSGWAHAYHALWHQEFSISIADYSISNTFHHWINDGLMAMFFFVVGLEIKYEIIAGNLSSPKQAILPLVAAIGGMALPALLFMLFNSQAPESRGWGIPMATDIAFSLGLLSLLGKRVPIALKVFLTALAIADDLGAVLVIAFFYTSDISLASLGYSAVFIAILIGANLMGIRSTVFYGIVGIGGLWLAFLLSGVHATIAGVLAALIIPGRTKINEVEFTKKLKDLVNEFIAIPPNDVTLLEPQQVHTLDKIKNLTRAADTPLQRLEHNMHPFVAFVIMPLFALANAGIEFTSDFANDLLHPVSLGVAAGLLFGKFTGITGTTFLMVRLKLAKLPEQLTWRHIIGVGFIAGIGFTMSLFIANLAFSDNELNLVSRTGVLIGSLISGVVGFLILRAARSNDP